MSYLKREYRVASFVVLALALVIALTAVVHTAPEPEPECPPLLPDTLLVKVWLGPFSRNAVPQEEALDEAPPCYRVGRILERRHEAYYIELIREAHKDK